MKYWLISIFLVLLVFLAGCKQGVTGEVVRETVQSTTSIEKTIVTTSAVEEIAPTSIETTPTIELKPFTIGQAKSEIENILVGDYDIEKLYKVTTSHNNLVIETDFGFYSKDSMTQKAYDLTQDIAPYLSEYNKGFEITLVSRYNGAKIRAATSNDVLARMANLELGFKDWQRWASISYEGDIYKG